MSKRLLILEDGHVFEGEGFGGNHFQVGELIFHTGMMGYQDVLNDMSYYSQIVLMTYPMIGNFGINRDAFESIDSAVFGFVVGEHCEKPCNWRSEMTFNEFLKLKNIPAIADIDTRMLTRIIRNNGTMKAIMSDDENIDIEAIVAMLKAYDMPHNQVELVSAKKAFQIANRGDKVVLMDFGSKNDIIRELNKKGTDIIIVPCDTSADDIMMLHPDGIILSDGPGNPKDVPGVVDTLKALLGKVPMFGISLGSQLLALACGADTYKLKFGHHGCNHPVLHLESGKTEITSQNHGYAVCEDSLKNTGLVVTHRALNDKSVEGFKHETYPILAVQYHPEASEEKKTNYLYETFYAMMENKEGK